MPVLSQDQEKDVPECSGQEISQIFLGKIRFPGNGIRECRPLVPTIPKPDHSKSRFQIFLTKWLPFVQISKGWASRFQIPFEIWTICKQTGLIRISDTHCICKTNVSDFMNFGFVLRILLLKHEGPPSIILVFPQIIE